MPAYFNHAKAGAFVHKMPAEAGFWEVVTQKLPHDFQNNIYITGKQSGWKTRLKF